MQCCCPEVGQPTQVACIDHDVVHPEWHEHSLRVAGSPDTVVLTGSGRRSPGGSRFTNGGVSVRVAGRVEALAVADQQVTTGP